MGTICTRTLNAKGGRCVELGRQAQRGTRAHGGGLDRRTIVVRMRRLPYLRYDDLDPAAKEVWDAIVGSRADAILNEQGGLTGPFNAPGQAPASGRPLTSLGLALRYETSIPRRLTEVAILTVGARWQAEFEWWAHAQQGRRRAATD